MKGVQWQKYYVCVNVFYFLGVLSTRNVLRVEGGHAGNIDIGVSMQCGGGNSTTIQK